MEASVHRPANGVCFQASVIGRVSAHVLAPGRGRYACSVNASLIPHDLVVLSEPSKNRLMDTLPNAG